MLKITLMALIVSLACSLPAVAGNGKKPGNPGKGKGGKGNTSEKKRDPAEFFKHHDKNNDGKLSLDELKSKKGGDDAKRAEHFKKLDKDGDGFITMVEFTARGNKK